jgi:hypothetical protein
LAVSAGVCNAGRVGVAAAGLDATGLDLAPALAGAVGDCWADAPEARDIKATNINVALGIDLMRHPGPLKRAQLSTSAWSATTAPRFKELLVLATFGTVILRRGALAASRRMVFISMVRGARKSALLTMTVKIMAKLKETNRRC